MNDKTSPLFAAYMRFLQLAKALEGKSAPAEGMDANESALLEHLVLRWHEGSPMTVREAMALDHLGSPATMHKRITRLRDMGMIDTEGKANDRRTKFLVPSPAALEFFGALGSKMTQVLNTAI